MEYSSFQKAMAIIPKVTGLLSIIGSSFVVRHVLVSKQRRSLVYHRLLLGMSTSDIISSFALFLSTWPIPKGTPGAYMASGTTATCTAQGFFEQAAAIATPSYNSVLSMYYVLVVNFSWTERRVKGIEKYLHMWPICMGVGTSVTGLPLTLFNPAGFACWINAAPAGCDRTPSVPCQRGALSYIFRWAFFYGWIWLYFVVLTVAIVNVYCFVLRQERRADKYKIKGQALDRRRSRNVAHQAIMYVGAYYLTFFFGTVTRALELANVPIPTPISICFAIFFPLQGFFNSLIYVYPRYHKWKTDKKNTTSKTSHDGSSLIRFFSSKYLFVSKRSQQQGSSSTQAVPSSGLSTTQQSAQQKSSSIHSPQEEEQEQQEATTQGDSQGVLSNAPANCPSTQIEEEKEEVVAAKDVGHDAAREEEDTVFPLGLNMVENEVDDDDDDDDYMKSVLELALVAEM